MRLTDRGQSKPDITRERALELLSYDEATGEFVWRRSKKGIVAGAKAGSPTQFGYVTIRVDYKAYQAHVLAWLMTHGARPDCDIDHIDGDRMNNRLSNLRLASRQQNNGNARLSKANTSGFKGVTRYNAKPRTKPWIAQITVNGKRKGLGYFATPEEAHEAYAAAAVQAFGEYARPARAD